MPKKMKKVKKRPLTLLEIMIVIFLIGLISSVIGVNLKKSLDEGRSFKSEQGAAQIRDLLLLEVAKGRSIQKVVEQKEMYLKESGMVKNVKALLKDGWGKAYVITIKNNNDISVKSEANANYKANRKKKLGPDELDQDQTPDDDNDDN